MKTKLTILEHRAFEQIHMLFPLLPVGNKCLNAIIVHNYPLVHTQRE